MFFDDETIYGGHLCPHTYENEDKNKKCWKSRQLPFHSNCFVIWIAFICKDLHCDVKFKWTGEKKKLCAETTIHNILKCTAMIWFFLVPY